MISRITVKPDICHGKPTVRGLRYPVENILELLASGMTHEEILQDYEDLEDEDLLACLLFAARLAKIKIDWNLLIGKLKETNSGLKKQELTASADLYAGIYEGDNELKFLTEAAINGWD